MRKDIVFEESLTGELGQNPDAAEVSLSDRPLFLVGIAVVLAGIAVAGRILFFGLVEGRAFAERAAENLSDHALAPAPRGAILDRFGEPLAENRAAFVAVLDVREFLRREDLVEETLQAIETTLAIPREDIWNLVREYAPSERSEPIPLLADVSQNQLVVLKAKNLPTILVEEGFKRIYHDGPVFSAVVGYIGLPSAEDLQKNPELYGREFIGKTGVEAFYDALLRGEPGVTVRIRNAAGNLISTEKKSEPHTGESLTLTIDAGLQKYFYERMREGLRALGREAGAGIAIDPQSGEILALLSFPAYDNDILHAAGKNEEKRGILNDPAKPLFNRAVSGQYAPGSTIKPLVAVAALAEGVVDPSRTVFSPGYMEIPNPYDSEKPTRFLDWRYQGRVDLTSAIAQSSNVYFYLVGGGSSPGLEPPEILDGGGKIVGLGVDRLREWWQRFRLGARTGIDLPGEAGGFLPSIEWRQKEGDAPWLLGDTYNVAIGQGELLTTPIQLVSYVAAIANGGKIYQPILNKNAPHPELLADLSRFAEEIEEVQKGMRETVTSPLGTANRMADLAVSVAGKTGSAQIDNNKAENAFFVGYAPASAEATAGKPAEEPQIAVLVLVERAAAGSLNAVPIAKDILDWYYWNRINKKK